MNNIIPDGLTLDDYTVIEILPIEEQKFIISILTLYNEACKIGCQNDKIYQTFNEIFLSYSESKKNIKLIYKGELYEKNIKS